LCLTGDSKGGLPPLGKILGMGAMTETAVVVQKAYDCKKFPKSYRFSVGQSLVTTGGFQVEGRNTPSAGDLRPCAEPQASDASTWHLTPSGGCSESVNDFETPTRTI
jgi:hypothetical protein